MGHESYLSVVSILLQTLRLTRLERGRDQPRILSQITDHKTQSLREKVKSHGRDSCSRSVVGAKPIPTIGESLIRAEVLQLAKHRADDWRGAQYL